MTGLPGLPGSLSQLPAGCAVTISGGVAAVGEWTATPAWHASAVLAVLPAGTQARYLRVAVTGAGAGASIGWLWAGVGWQPSVGASDLTMRRQYGLARGQGLNPAALYRGRGTGGAWRWELDQGGALIGANVDALLGIVDHTAEQGMEPVCIVPDVRGTEYRRPAREILAEISALARNTVREVTLLGQSVMNYGRANAVWGPSDAPSPGGYTEPFARLLEAVAALPGIARVRFTSGHPSGVTDQLVRAVSTEPRICHHLHLPVQSGSDRILRLMRRGYTRADYLDAVRRLRAAMPDFAITTDVIVGFPGETGEDFEATRSLMNEAGFDNAFIFKYSPRPGTPAADMEDDVSEAEKMRRNQVLLEDQDVRGAAANRRLVGTLQDVLVEGPSLRNAARWAGRSPGNKIVVFEPAAGLQPGALAQIRITRAAPQTLYGDWVR